MVAIRPLPVVASALIGRTEQLDGLRGAFSKGSSRLLTLTGPPGVGKTRLAYELARILAGDFGDGVAWVDLGRLQDPTAVPAELARALGVVHIRDVSSVDAVATVLADRDVLLVIDNCEHLLESATDIGTLLERLPRLRIIATSRQRLHLRAEVEFPVPPLAIPVAMDAQDLTRLAGNPAVQMLLDRAPAHVTLNRRTAPSLVDICSRLDGLPLALELAAARLRVFTPSELAFRLEHRTVGLSDAARDAPTRHRTLDAAIDWSHELLPETERTVFRRLAVLVGDWTVEAAQAVCGLSASATLAAIESLLDQSLLYRASTDGAARFDMLVSIHDYAAGQLAASGELAATRARHARYFAGAAADWEGTLGTESENSEWTDFEAMQPDLTAALEYLAAGEARTWVGVALVWHGHIHGSLVQAQTLLDTLHEIEALADRGGVPGGLGDDARVAGLVAAGVIAFDRGAFTRADDDLRLAIQVAEARGDDRRRAIATSFLGHVSRGLGRDEDAATFYRAARSLCERRGDVRGCAWSAYDLGLLAADSVDPDDRATAEPLLREALVYFEDLEYDWAVAQSTRGLATVLLDRGAVDDAGRYLGRSLAMHDHVGDRRGMAQCLEVLADVAATRGSLLAAARLLGAAEKQRQLGATAPTDIEHRRLTGVDSKVVGALGRATADHEKHNGRTAGRSAVLAFAASIADPVPPERPGDITLTARQTEVAGLIASGQTNRQIGRALGISEKTAEIHVSNIMARLDVPSRAGVAAWVASHPASTT